jgi:AGCS family alanine or glycine:cation symporter
MFEKFFTFLNGIVWGPPMLVLILGVGLYLSVGLKGLTIRKLFYAFGVLCKRGKATKDEAESGEIPPYQALTTALSATIGTGNIAGVATALFLGGPGALFWMWVTALVGMATKYAEAVLAVRYREVDARGNHVGGPMYYIRNGLGKRWAWLGMVFAIFGAVAAFGIGNTVQVNSIADVIEANFSIPVWVTGVVVMIFVGLVLIGGIKRIGRTTSMLVPLMAGVYLFVGLWVLALNAQAIPGALQMVFTHAFSPIAAQGGFAGAAVWAALRFGVARGVFSNEAGMGSAPIAHAAAQTRDPVRQGFIAMLGTFIDTIIVCSITGLVILTSGVWDSGVSGAGLTSLAFTESLPLVGGLIVAVCLTLFAFTTVIGWSFYGERCAEYLFGIKAIYPYRVMWILVIPIGAMLDLEFIWLVADTFNALMALPNLIALALLSPVVFALTRQKFNRK